MYNVILRGPLNCVRPPEPQTFRAVVLSQQRQARQAGGVRAQPAGCGAPEPEPRAAGGASGASGA